MTVTLKNDTKYLIQLVEAATGARSTPFTLDLYDLVELLLTRDIDTYDKEAVLIVMDTNYDGDQGHTDMMCPLMYVKTFLEHFEEPTRKIREKRAIAKNMNKPQPENKTHE